MLMRRVKIEILSLRKSLWTKVSSRKHTPTKIFFGSPADLMLFGKVVYVMKGNEAKVELDWAARAEFVFDATSGEPMMRYYQVYLVSYFLTLHLYIKVRLEHLKLKSIYTCRIRLLKLRLLKMQRSTFEYMHACIDTLICTLVMLITIIYTKTKAYIYKKVLVPYIGIFP